MNLKMIKLLIRRTGGFLFYYAGFFHIFRFIKNILGLRLTILTYHRVTDKKYADIDASLPYLFTTTATFRKQLQFLKKWYKIITFEELAALSKKGKLPWNCLIITFDDGYEDTYYHAYPELRALQVPATFFVIADKTARQEGLAFWWDRVHYYFSYLKGLESADEVLESLGREVTMLLNRFKRDPYRVFAVLNTWDSWKVEGMLDHIQRALRIDEGNLAMANSVINWKQLKEIKDYVRIGSHTSSHVNLLHIDRAAQQSEIAESKRAIEENTSQQVNVFSYPCGIFDDDVRGLVKKAGYEFAVTTKGGVNDLSEPLALKRINTWEGSSLSLCGGFSKGYFAAELTGF